MIRRGNSIRHCRHLRIQTSRQKAGRYGGSIMIIFAVIIVIAALLLISSLWLASYVMTGKRQTLDEAFEWQSAHYDTSFYGKLEKKDYTVEGYKGYVLHAQLLKNPEAADDYIILTHGYTDNRMGSLKYAGIYLDMGFNCIIYDLRGHGENKPDFTTYGIRESEDLRCIIDDTRKRYKGLRFLGLHGESLGAATTVTVMKYAPKIDIAVADCGFSDIENVLRKAFRDHHLPQGIFLLAELGALIRYRYSLRSMRPIDSLDNNQVPILFIHGAEDDFITPKNSEDMMKRTKGKTALRLIDGAGHAASVLTAPDLYREYVNEFLHLAGLR